MSMRTLGMCVGIGLSFVQPAWAQEDASDEFGESVLSAPSEETGVEAPSEARIEARSEASEARSEALANPRIPLPPPEDEPEEVAPLTQDAEVAIAMAPSVGFGLAGAAGGLAGLGGLSGFSLGARTDFAFAADPRTFVGFGLRVSHSESSSSGFSIQSNQVEIPLVLQLYLDTPRRGVAVPTVRVVPAFRWLNQVIPGTIAQYLVGGRLDVGVGVTYFVTDWLAIRILGDLGFSVDVAYEGVDANNVQAYVSGDLGVVVRL